MNRTDAIRLIEKTDAIVLLGISDRTLEKLVRNRHFSEPLQLGKRVKWVDSVVQNWLKRTVAEQLTWEPPKRQRRISKSAA